MGHDDVDGICSVPAPVAALGGIRVQRLAAGSEYSLALSCDGRVYSWGKNGYGQLGRGERLAQSAPALMEGLEGVGDVAAGAGHSLAVTQSGVVFSWGRALVTEAADSLRPIVVEGFCGVSVRRVCADVLTAFAIGEDGELFSWGHALFWRLGHGDEEDQPSPKRVEALRDVRVSSVSVGFVDAVALAEGGLVYAWGQVGDGGFSRSELLPKPAEALRGVRVGSVAAAGLRSYAVADTGEVWAWGADGDGMPPLGHGEQMDCSLPKPIASLRGIKVDLVAAAMDHTLALAEDGSVYAWGSELAAERGALGLGASVRDGERVMPTPERIPALRVAHGL
jgi:alpha-tubulin suppressor-like RCC1 family protein